MTPWARRENQNERSPARCLCGVRPISSVHTAICFPAESEDEKDSHKGAARKLKPNKERVNADVLLFFADCLLDSTSHFLNLAYRF